MRAQPTSNGLKATHRPVTLRTVMLLRVMAMVAVVLVLVSWLMLALGIKPLTEQAARSAFQAVSGQVVSRLEAMEAGTRRTLLAGQSWWRLARPEVDDPTVFNGFFLPLVQSDPLVTSVVAGTEGGKAWMLLQQPDGGWRNRLTDVPRWGVQQWIEQKAPNGAIDRFPLQQDYDARRRPWYTAAATLESAQELAWTEPYRFLTTQELGVTASVWLSETSGHRFGVLGLDLRLQDLSAVTENARVGRNGLAWLMTQDGRLLALPARSADVTAQHWLQRIMTPAQELPLPVVREALQAWERDGQPADDVSEFGHQGHNWLVSATPYRLGQHRWWVVTAAAQSDFAPAWQRVALLVAAVWLALLFPLAWVVRLQARSIVRPLEAMARESVRIGQLNFLPGEQVPPSQVQEIEQLREAQNHTRQLLQEHQVALEEQIHQLEHARDEIHQLAFYDPLTRLPNRRLFTDRLQQALARAQRSGRWGAVLFIDLDNFKSLNDTLGHTAGDGLLQCVAQRLLDCVRHSDTVSRFGGDEFLVMLEDLTAAGHNTTEEQARAEANKVAFKIQTDVAKPVPIAGLEFVCTPSLGVVLFRGTEDRADLIKWADMAMYQAKTAGRNAVRFFDPAFQEQAEARVTLEGELRQAIREQAFQMWLQPQFDASRQVVGAEALLRWPHAIRGWVSPGEFIPVAESSGLIVELGEWVLRQACHQLAQWARDGRTRHWTLSVNVSARQFRHPQFVTHVQRTLEQTGAPADRLRLELTESLLLEDVQQTMERMTQLRNQGVVFSLDDFGTGYSSLAYLKQLPFVELKVDQSFVRDMIDDPSDAVLTRTMIALAHALGLVVLAEGVETEAQWQALQQEGCDLFQGYLVGRPMDLATFNQQLRADGGREAATDHPARG